MSVGNLTAATVLFSSTPLGGTSYRYIYRLLDPALMTNQELAIEFDPTFFGGLKDETSAAGFKVVTLDPNNPDGAPGRFSALALVDHPLPVLFGITVEYFGSGMPGSQPFSINQFNANGEFQSKLLDGVTTLTPEPAGMQLTALGLLVGGAFWVVKRRKATT